MHQVKKINAAFHRKLQRNLIFDTKSRIISGVRFLFEILTLSPALLWYLTFMQNFRNIKKSGFWENYNRKVDWRVWQQKNLCDYQGPNQVNLGYIYIYLFEVRLSIQQVYSYRAHPKKFTKFIQQNRHS